MGFRVKFLLFPSHEREDVGPGAFCDQGVNLKRLSSKRVRGGCYEDGVGDPRTEYGFGAPVSPLWNRRGD